MKLIDDSTDISVSPMPASTLNIIRQTNGVVRIHASNGGYLFSLVKPPDGPVFMFRDGFGKTTEPKQIT